MKRVVVVGTGEALCCCGHRSGTMPHACGVRALVLLATLSLASASLMHGAAAARAGAARLRGGHGRVPAGETYECIIYMHTCIHLNAHACTCGPHDTCRDTVETLDLKAAGPSTFLISPVYLK